MKDAQYLLGTLGVFVIKAILDYKRKETVNKDIVGKIASMINMVCAKDYLPTGGDEMLVGRAGFLSAIFTLRLVNPGC